MPDVIHVELHPAPSTPMNLAFGTIYAPRKAAGGVFVGYECREIAPHEFVITGYERDRRAVEIWRGPSLVEAFHRLSHALGMTA